MATEGSFNFELQDLLALQEGLGRIDMIRNFYVDGITAEEIVDSALANPPISPKEDLEIKNSFAIIDFGIDQFNADKGFAIDSKRHGDWLKFDQRAITWRRNGLDHLMQIFPHFDDKENIASWNIYGVVSYDTKTHRYLQNFSAASYVPLNKIAVNITTLLNSIYNYLLAVNKADIPLAVKFEA